MRHTLHQNGCPNSVSVQEVTRETEEAVNELKLCLRNRESVSKTRTRVYVRMYAVTKHSHNPTQKGHTHTYIHIYVHTYTTCTCEHTCTGTHTHTHTHATYHSVYVSFIVISSSQYTYVYGNFNIGTPSYNTSNEIATL